MSKNDNFERGLSLNVNLQSQALKAGTLDTGYNLHCLTIKASA
jgi:hypothetical protein